MPSLWDSQPGKERHDGARMTHLITIIQVVGPGVVKVHGQFHQPKTEHPCVEIDIALRLAGNRRHMMNAENISTHSLYPSPSFLNGACTLGLGSKAPEGQPFFRSPGNLLRALLLIHLLFSTLYLLRRFPKILESLPCEVLSSIK